MEEQGTDLLWTQPEWLAQAHAWIAAEVGRRDSRVVEPIEQPHVRPWSTVLRVPTTRGALYFKATAPALVHEPALTLALAGWWPERMPQILAADRERRWLLMSDGGATLRSLMRSAADLGHWERVLPLYAETQIALAERVPELLALGTLDRRLAALPQQYERLLEDTDALCLGQPDGLSAEEHAALRALAPRVAARCAELASYGIPESLNHDDFHDGNVFVQDGRYVFFDWGDACVSHPFFTLLVTLRSIGYRLGLEEHDPALARLRDVYLTSWGRYGSPATLLRAAELARRLGMLCRALTWRHVLAAVAPAQRAAHDGPVAGWLQEFLQAETQAGE